MSSGGIAVCAAIALAAGCGGSEPPPEPDAAPPRADLELGGATVNASTFVTLIDGEDVPLIGGAQGGFHVWTGLRVRGAAGMLRLEREARRIADDRLVLRPPTLVLDVPDEAIEAWWERPDGSEATALPSFMCPTPIGIAVRDQPIVLRAELHDEEGELLGQDEISFVPRCPVDDLGQAEFCAEICSG